MSEVNTKLMTLHDDSSKYLIVEVIVYMFKSLFQFNVSSRSQDNLCFGDVMIGSH